MQIAKVMIPPISTTPPEPPTGTAEQNTTALAFFFVHAGIWAFALYTCLIAAPATAVTVLTVSILATGLLQFTIPVAGDRSVTILVRALGIAALVSTPPVLLVLHQRPSVRAYVVYLLVHALIAVLIVLEESDEDSPGKALFAGLHVTYLVVVVLDSIGLSRLPLFEAATIDQLGYLRTLRSFLTVVIVATYLTLASVHALRHGLFRKRIPSILLIPKRPLWGTLRRTLRAVWNGLFFIFDFILRFVVFLIHGFATIFLTAWKEYLWPFITARRYLMPLLRYAITIIVVMSITGMTKALVPGFVVYLRRTPQTMKYLEARDFDAAWLEALPAVYIAGLAVLVVLANIAIARVWKFAWSEQVDEAIRYFVISSLPALLLPILLWLLNGVPGVHIPGFERLSLLTLVTLGIIALSLIIVVLQALLQALLQAFTRE